MSIADKITQLTNIRAAIRTALQNKGISAASSHDFADFAADIAAIVTGGTIQSSKRVSASVSGPTYVTPDSGYDGLAQVIVNMITRQAKTVTPGTANQTVSPDSGYQGLSSVTVEGDADLVAGNIKNGVSIFGVTGSYSGGSPSLQSKSVSPSTSQQVVSPDSGYDGLSQVTVAAIQTQTKSCTPSTTQQEITPDSGKFLSKVTVAAIQTQEKSCTPSSTQQEITPESGKYLTKVTVAGDADLIAENIKSGVQIFGVTGSYVGDAVNGSLIEITCSSNIDQVTATVNSHTYTANLNTSTHKAYVVIPYTDTTAARTCVLKGYVSGSQATSANVSMAAGIGYYQASLETSAKLYENGTWYGVSNPTWTRTGGYGSVSDTSSGLAFSCQSKNYSHTFTLSPNISTRGYTKFKIKYSLSSGTIYGSNSTTVAQTSFIKIGQQFINFPQTTGPVSNVVATAPVDKAASDDAALVVSISIPMETTTPVVLTIHEITFV